MGMTSSLTGTGSRASRAPRAQTLAAPDAHWRAAVALPWCVYLFRGQRSVQKKLQISTDWKEKTRKWQQTTVVTNRAGQSQLGRQRSSQTRGAGAGSSVCKHASELKSKEKPAFSAWIPRKSDGCWRWVRRDGGLWAEACRDSVTTGLRCNISFAGISDKTHLRSLHTHGSREACAATSGTRPPASLPPPCGCSWLTGTPPPPGHSNKTYLGRILMVWKVERKEGSWADCCTFQRKEA